MSTHSETTVQAPRELDAHELRIIAVHSHADPRSVEKVLAGAPMRSSVALRIHRAIRDLERRGSLPRLDQG